MLYNVYYKADKVIINTSNVLVILRLLGVGLDLFSTLWISSILIKVDMKFYTILDVISLRIETFLR